MEIALPALYRPATYKRHVWRQACMETVMHADRHVCLPGVDGPSAPVLQAAPHTEQPLPSLMGLSALSAVHSTLGDVVEHPD